LGRSAKAKKNNNNKKAMCLHVWFVVLLLVKADVSASDVVLVTDVLYVFAIPVFRASDEEE
jgi:hypothetical protein